MKNGSPAFYVFWMKTFYVSTTFTIKIDTFSDNTIIEFMSNGPEWTK